MALFFIGGIIMGLIKAAAGAIGGVMADQWKDFIYYFMGS